MNEKLKDYFEQMSGELERCIEHEYGVDLYLNERAISIIERIYLAGCAAQSVADREAIDKILKVNAALGYKTIDGKIACCIKSSLAAAAIKE